jgi:D-alanyl-D-alanine endopeptidase (penicillin-binding protein 7)
MLKSALGVLISLCALVLSTPPALAEKSSATSAKKTAAKKQAQRKAAPKGKAVVKRRVASQAPSASLNAREKLVKKVVVAGAERKVVYQRQAFAPTVPAVPPVLTAGDLAGLNATRDPLALHSNVALVMDQTNSQILFEKNSNIPLPIASLTKLMTALIVLESRQNMGDVLEVTADDIDREKNSSSRLRVGSRMTRENMLHIALMSSENRAASALGRNYPGGLPGFVAAMNAKAKALGMIDARYVDSTGLSRQNIASARDLAKLVVAAYQHPLIRQYSTSPSYEVDTGRYHPLQYINSNRLVKNPDWEIGLQKTGYISEAGRCLVMQAQIERRPVVMVFLDSKGKESRLGDAGRIRKWLEANKSQPIAPQIISHVSARQS